MNIVEKIIWAAWVGVTIFTLYVVTVMLLHAEAEYLHNDHPKPCVTVPPLTGQ